MSPCRFCRTVAPMLVFFGLAAQVPAAVPRGDGAPPALPLAQRLSPEARQKLVASEGGSEESEAAVDRGLAWLARRQAANGSWRLDNPAFADRATINNDIAGTAFGLLPFLGRGHAHRLTRDRTHEKTVERGLTFLVRAQDKQTGHLGSGAPGDAYAHAFATVALCEAYTLTKDPALRQPAQRAVNYIVGAQHPEGGWRYKPNEAGDLSVSGVMVLALQAGALADCEVPAATLRKAERFMASCSREDTYSYMPGGSATPTMTALGLLCRQYLARPVRGPDVTALVQLAPDGITKNMYFGYFATQLVFQTGGESWKTWNRKMRTYLLSTQDQGTGALAGSWSSQGDPWSATGGRLMQTSLAILTLEVYYRYPRTSR